MGNAAKETISSNPSLVSEPQHALRVVDSGHITDDRKIPTDHLIKVCLYRQGSKCCKYIVFSDIKQDFCCIKRLPTMKNFIDIERGMSAKGDNCMGLPDAKN